MAQTLAFFTAFGPPLAAADGDGSVSQLIGSLGINWQQFVTQLLVFLILFFILKKFAYQPILQVLDERKKRIEESMAQVEKIKQELAATEQTRQEIVARANEAANALIAKARADAEALTARKTRETARQIETMLQQAGEAAAQERERLVNELRQEMGRLVVLTTSKVIGRTLTAEDQERLQQEALAGLKN